MAKAKVPSKSKSPQELTHRIQLLCLNLWHGLDHTRPLLMLPAENPVRAWLRKAAQIQTLKQEFARYPAESCLQLLSLQEINPITRRAPQIARELGLKTHWSAVNTGVRLGRISYPPFLEEGLGNFFSAHCERPQTEKLFVSGQGYDRTLPGGIPLSAQLKERRGALMSRFFWRDMPIALVNLHLHAGPPELASLRRGEEIEKLIAWIDLKAGEDELVFIAGDFNSRPHDPELKQLADAGFERLSPSEDLHTWDPAHNAVCRASTELDRDNRWKEWDFEPKSIDHIFVRRKNKKPRWQVDCRLFATEPVDGHFISDHFGWALDIQW